MIYIEYHAFNEHQPVTSNEERPALESIKSSAEFERWYWLNTELLDYCRAHKLGTTGQKRELASRIVFFLDTGTILKPVPKRSNSSFDWGKAKLTTNTVITDNYRNSQNMREFMKTHVGNHFSFPMNSCNGCATTQVKNYLMRYRFGRS